MGADEQISAERLVLTRRPGAAHLLPGRGDRPRIADADRRVEAANVDAELERVGGHHPPYPTVAQAALDLLALVRQVAAAVAADRVRVAGRRRERLAQVGGQHLDRGARLRERDRLHAAGDQPLRHALAGQQRRAADAELLVGDRRVDDEDVPAPGRRAVVVHQLDGCFDDALSQVARVGDGRAGADEDRVRPVVVRDATQAPDHVGHMAAEQAAVGVQLVDDDELQVLEQLEPLGVVGEDRGVEHVRVRDHDLPGRSHHRCARWAACRRRRCGS